MPSLMLHPGTPDWAPRDRPGFVALLDNLGLIDRAGGDAPPDGFRPGDQLLSLVMFLGCAPRVSIESRDALQGQPVCRLRDHLFSNVRFLSSGNAPPVRCPSCRSPAVGEIPRLPDWQFSCPQCGQAHAAHALDWRQTAGFSRCFLEISPVYPHEAVPSDHLMARLRDYSGGDWRYFYLDDGMVP